MVSISPSMLLAVTSAGWRLQGLQEPFELTRALRPESHLELNWRAGATATPLTEVWVDLYLTDRTPVQKLMVYQLDAQELEWRFTFDGPYEPLVVPLAWNGVDEEAGEITLHNDGVPGNLLDEIEVEAEV